MRVSLLIIVVFGLALAACAGTAVAPGSPTTPPAAASSPALTVTATPAPTASPSPTAVPVPTFLAAEEVPLLVLSDLWPPRDLSSLRLDLSRIRTLIATGDVIPARRTDVAIRQQGDDFLYPVAATSEITSAADLTLVNLEAPLIDGCPYHDSGFTFCGRPGFTAALQSAGVDVVTLENNHITNYGRQGMAETVGYLDAAGIVSVDRDSPAVIDVRGVRFGILAFNGVGENIDRAAMSAQIEVLRLQVDVLVVAFHWGAEYVALPEAAPGIANDDPVEIAHEAADAGADLIIGNHPHWVQGVELYQGSFIAYAHGNFIFDQMWSYKTRVGVIGRYTFYDATLIRVEFTPVLIEDFAQPNLLTGAEAQVVLEEMRVASEELRDRLAAMGSP